MNMKRIFLFLVTNIAILLVMSLAFHLICEVFGIGTVWVDETGIDYGTLLFISAFWGMAGSFISLLLSKSIAKWSVGAKTITGTEGVAEAWLVSTVNELANRAGIRCPEVAIYEGEANAFATGAFKNNALVAVSTGIMSSMTKSELRAVLGHEISHVSNGDMVTMTLLQGILNTFVIFLSRVGGFLADTFLSKNDKDGGMIGYLITILLQILFGIMASLVVMGYSRHREYAADADSAKLLGSPSDMIAALRRLGNLEPGVLPDSLKAMGISGKRKTSIWSTHPSLEDRIEALQKLR